MRLAVLIFLLLTTTLSLASPVAGFLAKKVFTGALAKIITVTWGSVIFTAATMLYGQSQQRKRQKAAEDAAKAQRARFEASVKDRQISGIAQDLPYRYIYGEDKVGCNVVAMFSTGTNDTIKHLVAVICQHEIEEICEIYLNNKPIGTLDINGNSTAEPYAHYDSSSITIQNIVGNSVVVPEGTTEVFVSVSKTWNIDPVHDAFLPESSRNTEITNAQYPIAFTWTGNTVTYDPIWNGFVVNVSAIKKTLNSKVVIKKRTGGINDPADPDLIAAVPDKWTANHLLKGHAYIYLRLDQSMSEFQNGIPAIHVKVKGKKIYDPRTMLTAYSSNPALVAYDYLTSEMCNIPAADLNESQFITAANDCDDYLSSVNGARYTFNGAVNADQNQGEVLEKIAQSMAGGIVATTWDIYAGKYRAPVMTLSQSDIVGECAISPGYPREEIYNVVKGQFVSPENSYEVADFKPYKNEFLITQDGEELETNIDLPYTNTQQRCSNLARIFVEDNRAGYSINAKFSLKAWGLTVGERVAFTSEFFGQIGKVFRVTDKTIHPDATVNIAMKEDTPEIYDEADQVVVDQTANTGFPDPYDIADIENLEAFSGTNELAIGSDGTLTTRILAKWTQSTTPTIKQNGVIDVQWRNVVQVTETWTGTSVSGDQTYAYILPVTDLNTYYIRVRARNPYLGIFSNWTYIIHYVIGKSEPPSDVQTFSIDDDVLEWTPVGDFDLAGYEIRFNYGLNYDWNAATVLTTGIVTASPYKMAARPSGRVTLMIKAVDTTGNYSRNAASVVTLLGDPPIANVVEVFQFDPTFLGTITDGTVSGGDLCADANDSFYGPDTQSFYGLETESLYKVSTYKTLVYETQEQFVTSALVGSVMSLDIDYTGQSVSIEYRKMGGGSFYGPDGDGLYTIDDDESFYGAPGPWLAWPGQIIAENDSYQFRITIAGGETQGCINTLAVTIDAPDIEEQLDDVTIAASGTVPAYTENFTVIKNIQVTLQTNASGGVSVEVDKTTNLAPIIYVLNASQTPVSGAKVDLIIKGY